MENRIYHLHALSSLHVGNGEAGGVIDMPVAREKSSKLPMIPGSGIKGVLRYELAEGNDLTKENWSTLFGPESDSENIYAGALSVGDARLLLLPIRSYKGTFAWATCPMILRRYVRDLVHAGANVSLQIPDIQSVQHAHATTVSKLSHDDKIFLEDLDLDLSSEKVDEWADLIAASLFAPEDDWKQLFKSRFIVLHDDVFCFLSETATEIRARIKIKEDTRSVEKGGLWYEENLPAETIMWGVIASDRARDSSKTTAKDLIKMIPKSLRLQIGGNASVGNGQTQWYIKE